VTAAGNLQRELHPIGFWSVESLVNQRLLLVPLLPLFAVRLALRAIWVLSQATAKRANPTVTRPKSQVTNKYYDPAGAHCSEGFACDIAIHHCGEFSDAVPTSFAAPFAL